MFIGNWWIFFIEGGNDFYGFGGNFGGFGGGNNDFFGFGGNIGGFGGGSEFNIILIYLKLYWCFN